MNSHVVEHSDTGLLIVRFLRVTIHKNPVRQNQIQQYVCGSFLVSGSGQRNQENHSMFCFHLRQLCKKKKKKKKRFIYLRGWGFMDLFMDLFYFPKKKDKCMSLRYTSLACNTAARSLSAQEGHFCYLAYLHLTLNIFSLTFTFLWDPT